MYIANLLHVLISKPTQLEVKIVTVQKYIKMEYRKYETKKMNQPIKKYQPLDFQKC